MKKRFKSVQEFKECFALNEKFTADGGDMKLTYAGNESTIKNVVRAMRYTDNSVFVFSNGSRKWGGTWTVEDFIEAFTVNVKAKVDEATAWERRVKNVIKKLDASGLWPHIKKEFEELLEIGFERRAALKDVYWNREDDNLRKLMDAIIHKEDGAVERYNAAFERLYGKFMNEIPFAFRKGNRGVWDVRTCFLYEMSEARTKSMYFGKWRNADIKAAIADALANKRKYSAEARTSYDVRFSYDPENDSAYYSEEYKDCGNGHYYIAIDGNTALFCEDD